ncbi:hypothetical protein AB3X94_37160 [Paraburkholderia sp. BR10923]|uniref:hypothetical protein n=1 Tax=Paraburkholderia sp. BR10923 TaxID=3236992 RepID=UPI0034CE98EF
MSKNLTLARLGDVVAPETLLFSGSLIGETQYSIYQIDPSFETIRLVVSCAFPTGGTNNALVMQFGMPVVGWWNTPGMYLNRHTLSVSPETGINAYDAPQNAYAVLGGGSDAGGYIDMDMRIYRHPNNPGRPITWNGHGPFRNTAAFGTVWIGGWCSGARSVGQMMDRFVLMWDTGVTFGGGQLTVIGCK